MILLPLQKYGFSLKHADNSMISLVVRKLFVSLHSTSSPRFSSDQRAQGEPFYLIYYAQDPLSKANSEFCLPDWYTETTWNDLRRRVFTACNRYAARLFRVDHRSLLAEHH